MQVPGSGVVGRGGVGVVGIQPLFDALKKINFDSKLPTASQHYGGRNFILMCCISRETYN